MTHTVNIYDAKTNLSKLVDRAAAGGEIVTAKAGKPKANLVPHQPPPNSAGFGKISSESPTSPIFRCTPAARAAEVFRVGSVRLPIDTHILLWADRRPV